MGPGLEIQNPSQKSHLVSGAESWGSHKVLGCLQEPALGDFPAEWGLSCWEGPSCSRSVGDPSVGSGKAEVLKHEGKTQKKQIFWKRRKSSRSGCCLLLLTHLFTDFKLPGAFPSRILTSHIQLSIPRRALLSGTPS